MAQHENEYKIRWNRRQNNGTENGRPVQTLLSSKNFEEQDNVYNSNLMDKKMATKRDGISCVKYCIYGFNVVLVVIGFALAALGVWLKTDHRFREFLSQRYRQVVTDQTWDAPTLYAFAFVLIALGIVMIVVALFGCCGAIVENYCLLIAYFACLMILFFVTLSCGLFLFVKRDSIDNEVGDAMDYMVQHYYQGPGVIQEAMDQLQQAFRCCGSSGCGDYRELKLDVPRSCDIACDGCRERIYRALRVGFTIATVIFIIVLIVQLLGICLSMYLFCWLRSHRTASLYYYGPQSKILREDPPMAGYYPTLSTQTTRTTLARSLPTGLPPAQSQRQQFTVQQHGATKQPAYHQQRSPQQVRNPQKIMLAAPPRPPPPYREESGPVHYSFK